MGSFNYPWTTIKALALTTLSTPWGLPTWRASACNWCAVNTIVISHRVENSYKQNHNQVLNSISRAELITVRGISSWALSSQKRGWVSFTLVRTTCPRKAATFSLAFPGQEKVGLLTKPYNEVISLLLPYDTYPTVLDSPVPHPQWEASPLLWSFALIPS